MEKDFNKAAQPSAVEQVMAIILAGQDDDIPTDLMRQAIKEGLTKNFSFYLSSEIAEDIGDKAKYVALIYPSSEDATFKSVRQIGPMVPEMKAVDACGATEWHFPKKVKKLSDMAAYLVGLGFRLDSKEQKRVDSKVYNELKNELRADLVKSPSRKKPKGPKR